MKEAAPWGGFFFQALPGGCQNRRPTPMLNEVGFSFMSSV